MKASVVELRYKMKDVLQALRRNEEVQILYHGKPAGTIVPVKKDTHNLKASNHLFFGMSKAGQNKKSVEKAMDKLRGGRYPAL